MSHGKTGSAWPGISEAPSAAERTLSACRSDPSHTAQSRLLFQDQSNLVETPITTLAAWPQTSGFNLPASSAS